MKTQQVTKKEPQIQNVVSLAKLSEKEIDLSILAQKLSNSHYNPRRFPAVIFKKSDPKSTVLVFRSGKLIIIGSKSEVDADRVAKFAAKKIGELVKKKIRVQEFSVTNIVANASLGFEVDVTSISQQPKFMKDEQFPGVIHNMGDPVKAVLIFSSGKLVFTGAKNIDRIREAYNSLCISLDKEKYRKDTKIKTMD